MSIKLKGRNQDFFSPSQFSNTAVLNLYVTRDRFHGRQFSLEGVGVGWGDLLCTLFPLLLMGVSLVAQTVKGLPAVTETRVRSLGREDPLEKEMATHSSILVWRIPWMEEPVRLYSPWGRRVGLD